MKDDAREFVSAVGALAEVCGLFYRHLIENGLSNYEALELVKTYITATLTEEK